MGEFERIKTLPPWMEIPEKFFNTDVPPQYREDAIKLIPQMWNEKGPEKRRQILGSKMPQVDENFFELSWEEIVKMWGVEETLQTFLYALYGDDKDPLYTSDEKYL